MLKKIMRAALAVALIIPAFTFTAPEVAASGGACLIANHTNSHIFIRHETNMISGAQYFDDVAGRSSIRDLTPCVGYPGGGTFVLPANVSGGGYIYQLGYGEMVIGGDGSPYFYYALGSPDAIRINSPRPILNHTYIFHIYKRSTGRVSFDIYDEHAGAYVWTYYPSNGWPTSLDVAWWGFETWESESRHGGTALGQTAIWGMTYSWEDVTTSTTKKGFTCSYPITSNNQIQKNFGWDNPQGNVNPCQGGGSTRLGSVSTAIFYNDTLNVWTTD